VVFSTSVSTPGYNLVNNDKYPNIVADYRRTFEILKSLPCGVFLGPHAEFFSMKEKMARMERGAKSKPFVDPAGYREYVANGEKEFQMTLEAQSRKKSAGQ
jgi:metallo-beta-lactamase class B